VVLLKVLGVPWADVLIVRAMAADAAAGKTSKNPLDIGLLAAAIGQRQGFESANADHYLDRLLAVQLANGGFGLPYSFDSWGDGRVTPVGAAHTISMYQAGLALLPAYEAGVPGVEVALDRMVTKLASMPFVTVKPGKCMSYSDHLTTTPTATAPTTSMLPPRICCSALTRPASASIPRGQLRLSPSTRRQPPTQSGATGRTRMRRLELRTRHIWQ
jgi:hypothetical protein